MRVQDRIVANDTELVAEVERGKIARQRRSVQEKRQIVEATLAPGASIARVARAYGVNANQLFHWRKLFRQGLLEEAGTVPRLLPVQVSELSPQALTTSLVRGKATRQGGSTGSIRIEIAGKGRLSMEGFDERGLRTVLEYFLR